MLEAKNTARALVRIGHDGRVYKTFRATDAEKRFQNEVRVLKYLEERECEFVPRLLEADPQELLIVTTSCGARVEHLDDKRTAELFAELEAYGVRHDDPFIRNVTYRAADGRFCIIDFEFATIIDEQGAATSPLPVTLPPANRTMAIRWSAANDIGKFRPNNEDAFLATTFDAREFHYLGKEGEVTSTSMDFVFAVSDGMGGEKSGEFASRLTIDNITKLLPNRFGMSPANYRTGFSEILRELIQRTHRQLTKLGESYSEGHNMGSTLSLIWLASGAVHFAHIGDSRIYHFPAGRGMRQISDDDTHVGWLRRQGKLNEREARSHPRKNVLTQSLGAGNFRVDPQIGSVDVNPGDRFLLCTDGIVEGLWDHAIEDIVLGSPKGDSNPTIAQRIVTCAVDESGRDNCTAVLVELLR